MKLWLCLCLFLSPYFSLSRNVQVVTTISIDQAETRQTITGFGVSGAWWAQVIGGWSPENRQRIIDLMFSPTEGIGLTIYRYNIGGGEDGLIDPWRMTESFDAGPGQYDWSRDANALAVLRLARDAGVTDVVVFANSPPERMTLSGRASGNPGGGSNLQPDMHEAFARYLVDITRHLIEDEGIPVRWISPINEPQWDWQPSKGQEGAHYTTDEVVSVLRALQTALEQSGLDVEISAIDAGEWQTASVYASRIFEDPVLAANLDHFAVHSYWSDAADKTQFVRFMQRHFPDVTLWMTEWTEMQEGRDYGMDSALWLANTVHDDLTIGGVTSWQYWIGVSKYNFRDGLLYTREYSERIEETQRLWALGNYSRFVRPGAVRVEASSTNEQVKVSAYTNPSSGALTVVVINNQPSPVPIGFEGLTSEQSQVSIYATSETQTLDLVFSGGLPEQWTLAPSSISTFVFETGQGG
jgi:O-glycosyl hydrolase